MLPDYYDTTSLHNGPNAERIPEHFKGLNSDRTMHHMIRYYGEDELGKCNHDQKVLEGESKSNWEQPVNFVGEFPGCGKPTGRVWLTKAKA